MITYLVACSLNREGKKHYIIKGNFPLMEQAELFVQDLLCNELELPLDERHDYCIIKQKIALTNEIIKISGV